MVHQQTRKPVGKCGPLVKRLRHRPLTPVTGVRFPHGSPSFFHFVFLHIYFDIRGRESFDHTVGDYYTEDPPVPIPNTVVKLSCAENTWRVAAWKDRSSPTPGKESLLSPPLYSSIAQSVEHATVNRRVVGSSPTWGAMHFKPALFV